MRAVINKMSLKFESHSVNEAFARQAVGAFVAQLDPTMEELGDIKTVVSEAFPDRAAFDAAVEAGLAAVRAPASFQFLRQGYFCVDNRDSAPGRLVFNRSVGLKDSFKVTK